MTIGIPPKMTQIINKNMLLLITLLIIFNLLDFDEVSFFCSSCIKKAPRQLVTIADHPHEFPHVT